MTKINNSSFRIKIYWYKKASYKVVYTYFGHYLEFECYKIESEDEEEIKKSRIEKEASISGRIKWDGCLDFEQKDHYCSIINAKQVFILFNNIYKFSDGLGYEV